MQLVPQVKEVGAGASGLKHAATERSGERSDLNKRCCRSQAADERNVGWEAGTKTAHRVSDRKGLDFRMYSDSVRRCSDQYQLEIADIT